MKVMVVPLGILAYNIKLGNYRMLLVTIQLLLDINFVSGLKRIEMNVILNSAFNKPVTRPSPLSVFPKIATRKRKKNHYT